MYLLSATPHAHTELPHIRRRRDRLDRVRPVSRQFISASQYGVLHGRDGRIPVGGVRRCHQEECACKGVPGVYCVSELLPLLYEAVALPDAVDSAAAVDNAVSAMAASMRQMNNEELLHDDAKVGMFWPAISSGNKRQIVRVFVDCLPTCTDREESIAIYATAEWLYET